MQSGMYKNNLENNEYIMGALGQFIDPKNHKLYICGDESELITDDLILKKDHINLSINGD